MHKRLRRPVRLRRGDAQGDRRRLPGARRRGDPRRHAGHPRLRDGQAAGGARRARPRARAGRRRRASACRGWSTATRRRPRRRSSQIASTSRTAAACSCTATRSSSGSASAARASRAARSPRRSPRSTRRRAARTRPTTTSTRPRSRPCTTCSRATRTAPSPTGRRVVAALSGGRQARPARDPQREARGVGGRRARTVLVLAAQLAAEAGMPLLRRRPVDGGAARARRQAGRQGRRRARSTASRMGVAGVPEVEAGGAARQALARGARRSPALHDAKVELGGFEEVACADYPLALSLRIADVLKKLPRLRHGAEPGAHCGPLRSLDAFLAGADKGAYDPDAFTRAAEEALRADGKIDERPCCSRGQKRPGQCDPTIVARGARARPLAAPRPRRSAPTCSARPSTARRWPAGPRWRPTWSRSTRRRAGSPTRRATSSRCSPSRTSRRAPITGRRSPSSSPTPTSWAGG